jgi:hypothetical protein
MKGKFDTKPAPRELQATGFRPSWGSAPGRCAISLVQEWLSSGPETYLLRTGDTTKVSASLATYVISNPRSVPSTLQTKALGWILDDAL